MNDDYSRYPEAMQRLFAEADKKLAGRPKLLGMFKRCFASTLETTTKRMEDGSTFVITGDIPAMWLRDSSAQVRHYIPLAAEDAELGAMIEGVVRRQMMYVGIDPYANAFNESPNDERYDEDLTDLNPWVWERKYEIDSLCYPLHLAYLLWQNAGTTTQFNGTFRKAAALIIELWRKEQNHEQDSDYRFVRRNCPVTDTLPRDGKGTVTGPTGMTWSAFRPSDDACDYGYLIPSNMFAVVALRELAKIARDVLGDVELETEAERLAAEIDAGIRAFGIVNHPQFGDIYAYETDGLGNYKLMDDANVPSLLSIPYLGYTGNDDPTYVRTRNFILSEHNPYFFSGKEAAGIGSPHTPHRYIWPIALAMQGLTAREPEEKLRLLDLLERTDGGAGMMHEGFDADDASKYTRPWFSWANMMYCELVLDVCGIRVAG